jgi:type II restriction enzyme
MATSKQLLGTWGEQLVAKSCDCPKCKHSKTLKLLPPNFKCADLICDFCGFLGQGKAMTVPIVSQLPKQILGAA